MGKFYKFEDLENILFFNKRTSLLHFYGLRYDVSFGWFKILLLILLLLSLSIALWRVRG